MTKTRAMEGEIIPGDAATLAHVERDPYQVNVDVEIAGHKVTTWFTPE